LDERTTRQEEGKVAENGDLIDDDDDKEEDEEEDEELTGAFLPPWLLPCLFCHLTV